MLRKFVLFNTRRYLSHWVILLFDLHLVAISFALAVLMRFNFDLSAIGLPQYAPLVLGVLIAYFIGFLIFRSYRGVVRHTGLVDALTIFKSCAVAVAFLGLLSFAQGPLSAFAVPRSILAILFFSSVFLLVGARLFTKYFYQILIGASSRKRVRVLIYGAGASGIITRNTLDKREGGDFRVVAFVDDNPNKQGKTIGGIPVHAPEKVFGKEYFRKNSVDQLIIAMQGSLSTQRRQEIVEMGLEHGLEVKSVPPFERWIGGELSSKQIKPVKIEDLLGRDPIALDNVNVSRELRGKAVLITGAAGSIGSEIVRQVLHYKPEKVILLDQAESALHDLELEIKSAGHPASVCMEVVVADVTHRRRMQRVFEAFDIDVVFHAAAYKHVPLMEQNPVEAVHVNVFGTKVVADLAAEYRVAKFVLVSTDKAVNPTNVMGATKRTAEIYTQSLGTRGGCVTQFIITRFGNVLGSNGSVLPLFKKQISGGGPITITDKKITRYFMTIPEACNLVLEAGAMGQGGEVMVFDMGKAVRIYDLAIKMIKLSGLQPGADIEIKEIGLRPGEKLYEELLALQENTKPTHHPKIMVADIAPFSYAQTSEYITELERYLDSCDNFKLVSCLKKIVPEYISNNSVYASLDKKIVNE